VIRVGRQTQICLPSIQVLPKCLSAAAKSLVWSFHPLFRTTTPTIVPVLTTSNCELFPSFLYMTTQRALFFSFFLFAWGLSLFSRQVAPWASSWGVNIDWFTVLPYMPGGGLDLDFFLNFIGILRWCQGELTRLRSMSWILQEGNVREASWGVGGWIEIEALNCRSFWSL
jgi:hypothetical protein